VQQRFAVDGGFVVSQPSKIVSSHVEHVANAKCRAGHFLQGYHMLVVFRVVRLVCASTLGLGGCGVFFVGVVRPTIVRSIGVVLMPFTAYLEQVKPHILEQGVSLFRCTVLHQDLDSGCLYQASRAGALGKGCDSVTGSGSHCTAV